MNCDPPAACTLVDGVYTDAHACIHKYIVYRHVYYKKCKLHTVFMSQGIKIAPFTLQHNYISMQFLER